jgi:hypothetical protein
MSIWTETDRDNIKDAILSLTTGKRVVQTDIGGKQREFGQASLPAMRALLADIVADIETAAGISGHRRVSTTIKSDTW